ncbi:MAG: CHAT domain-containing protein [Nostoc sp. DedQUE12a]|nr:CHAT domain-containing protein [Nostoc sp. DedQUE12a]
MKLSKRLLAIAIFSLVLSLHIHLFNPVYAQQSIARMVQSGKEFYDVGQFSQAAQILKQAAQEYDRKKSPLHQAQALSLLSFAYQKLGQWQAAQNAIAESLILLKSASKEPEYSQILAQVLNTQGHLQFTKGEVDAALETWQRAETAYRQAKDNVGVIGSRISQAQALQSLGFYRRAQKQLLQIEAQVQQTQDFPLKTVGLQNLGNLYNRVGELQIAKRLLIESVSLSRKINNSTLESQGLLSLGNTERLQAKQSAVLNYPEQVERSHTAALEYYQQVAAIASSVILRTQAQVNQLSLLLDMQQLTAANTLWMELEQQLSKLPVSRSTVYIYINLAQSLGKLPVTGEGGRGQGADFLAEQSQPAMQKALLQRAIEQADTLEDLRAKSTAMGSLGQVEEGIQNFTQAQALTEQALQIAEEINAPDLIYQWQWQMGRLLEKGRGDTGTQGRGDGRVSKEAIAYYTQAVKSLQSLRGDLVALNPDIQFSFRESVEPVYRQLVDLLLREAEPSIENLSQARNVIEALQIAELDNFFRDACSLAQPVSIDNLDPNAAIIYPIVLSDRLEIIVKLPGKNSLRHYTQANVSETQIDDAVANLLTDLRKRSTSLKQTKTAAKKLYDWLIQPIASELQNPQNQVQTLAFVMDGSLRNIPPAILYDGKQYLIENYGVVLTPGLQLFSSQPWADRNFKTLLAGTTKAPSFEKEHLGSLDNVAVELAEISQEVSQSKKLEDGEFLLEKIRQNLETQPFDIVHIATHGKFSSDPEQTYILDWNKRINIRDLDSLFRNSNPRENNPTELLILSACETAVGDKRAALGLAGIAIRAGARSTIATLIQINDASTAEFMQRLYKELQNPSLSKVEALRNTQLAFLKDYPNTDYNRPYYWASFILAGNWL